MSIAEICNKMYGKTIRECSNEQVYTALLALVKKVTEERKEAQERQEKENGKKVYYISAEFLIGKLLSNNLINLGLYEQISQELEENGKNIAQIEEAEPEPSLGNGGLGRLAACFLDSIATLNLNGDGIGINYHLGLFRQVFAQNKQTEQPDYWIQKESWLTKTEVQYPVQFGKLSVMSRMYDIDVTGYEGRVNKLHLFDIDTVDEKIPMHDGIDFDKNAIEKNLTLFLYPDDSDRAGQLLRIYQQYFMVSNAAQLILSECRRKCEKAGKTLKNLNEFAVIQINDTHPTMVIPELIRILTTQKDIDGSVMTMQEAAEVVTKTCAYTNHTILAEALETWPLDYLEEVVPQLVPIIRYLDENVRARYTDSSVYIIDENDRVHMAHIDIHYGFSVNGVAKLHTEILMQEELKSFYRIYPEKFNNKTNGITFRRWLLHCNQALTAYIEELIGADFKKEAGELSQLIKYADDEKVLTRFMDIKHAKKEQLAKYIKDTEGVEIDPDSMFDIQIKRMHEYKRQLLNAFYILDLYFRIKENPEMDIPKTTFIFGAKAFPGYRRAKTIVKFINEIARLVDEDEEVSKKIKVHFVENYRVSYAEKLFPAADLSKQISTAGKEASGTGNMKFMLNGAPTFGTLDGANVEIVRESGEENNFIFGLKVEDIQEIQGKYKAKSYYESDDSIRRVMDTLIDGTLNDGGTGDFDDLFDSLIKEGDQYFLLADFESFKKTEDEVFNAYKDKMAWAKKCFLNVCNAGIFSSDRTILQYADEIWDVKRTENK